MCARVHFSKNIKSADDFGRELMEAYALYERDDCGAQAKVGEIFPGDIAAVAAARRAEAPEIVPMRWGIPAHKGRAHINARSETALCAPAFAQSAQIRRCLLLADCFYEWQSIAGAKLKYEISCADFPLLYIAGIYTQCEPRRSCFAVLTAPAPECLEGIHSRMPVVLPEHEARAWLAPNADYAALVAAALTCFAVRKV